MNNIGNIGVYHPNIFRARSGFTKISLHYLPHKGEGRYCVQ